MNVRISRSALALVIKKMSNIGQDVVYTVYTHVKSMRNSQRNNKWSPALKKMFKLSMEKKLSKIVNFRVIQYE